MALDTAGNIYVATLAQAATPMSPALSGAASIVVFVSGATGNVAPTRVISGSATMMGEISSLRVDISGNIYVLSQTTILKFAPGASGNIAPADAISSTAFITPNSSLAVQ